MGQYWFVQIFLGGDTTTDITNVMIHENEIDINQSTFYMYMYIYISIHVYI